MVKKTPAQLDREIADVLARSHGSRRSHSKTRSVRMPASASKTLRDIAKKVHPYSRPRGAKTRIAIADHVDRRPSHGTGTHFSDGLVNLASPKSGTTRVQQPSGFVADKRTEIPFGWAYVSLSLSEFGEDTGITILIPPLDQATLDVAVDAMLTAGKLTPVVTEMIGAALGVGPGLLRDAYVALVAQIATDLSSGES